MEVSWDHPKAQRPENGYRLVFAPFADVIDQKPWIEVVDGDTNTVSSNCEPPYVKIMTYQSFSYV